MGKVRAVAAEERESTYKLLAGLYLKPPLDAFIRMIKDDSVLSMIFSNDTEEGKGSLFYSELVRYVEDAAKLQNLKEELEAEHTSLFVLPGGVLPHEAAYLDDEKKLGGRITISVKQFYEKAGAEVVDDCIEMPDHLGMELEFMGFLCGLEKDLWKSDELSSLQRCIVFQKAFLEEHSLKWIYQCCDKINEKSSYGFYKAISNFTKDFMKNEEEYVSGLYAEVCKEGELICESIN